MPHWYTPLHSKNFQGSCSTRRFSSTSSIAKKKINKIFKPSKSNLIWEVCLQDLYKKGNELFNVFNRFFFFSRRWKQKRTCFSSGMVDPLQIRTKWIVNCVNSITDRFYNNITTHYTYTIVDLIYRSPSLSM